MMGMKCSVTSGDDSYIEDGKVSLPSFPGVIFKRGLIFMCCDSNRKKRFTYEKNHYCS